MLRFGKRDRRAPRIAVVRYNAYPVDMHIRRDVLALRDAGFDVDLICAHEPGKPFVERADGITVVRLPPRRRRGGVARYIFTYTTFPLLAAAIVALRSLRQAYCWVEINNMPDWLIVAALLPKLLGAKVTLYSRDNMPQLLALDHDLSPTHPAVRLLTLIQRTCGRLADCIITTHEMARRVLVQQGISADKIIIVPNSPDEQVFLSRVSKPASGRAKDPDGDRSFRLVTHGTLIKRYGLDTLIEAIAILCNRIPTIHLEIIGNGEYRAELETLVDRLGLGRSVTFTDYVPFDQIAPRLMQAHLGMVPVWTDFMLTNKLTEYLALGLPVITTESAALRLYLDDDAVYYVKPKSAQALADAIMTLYLDPNRRAALAAAGHAAYLEHFAWERAKRDYLAIYASHPDRRPGRDSHKSIQPQQAAANQ